MREQVPTWLAVVIIIVVVALVVGVFFFRGRQRVVITEEELKKVIGGQYSRPTPEKGKSGAGGPVGPMYQSPP